MAITNITLSSEVISKSNKARTVSVIVDEALNMSAHSSWSIKHVSTCQSNFYNVSLQNIYKIHPYLIKVAIRKFVHATIHRCPAIPQKVTLVTDQTNESVHPSCAHLQGPTWTILRLSHSTSTIWKTIKSLGSNAEHRLVEPKWNLKTYGYRAFYIATQRELNCLPRRRKDKYVWKFLE